MIQLYLVACQSPKTSHTLLPLCAFRNTSLNQKCFSLLFYLSLQLQLKYIPTCKSFNKLLNHAKNIMIYISLHLPFSPPANCLLCMGRAVTRVGPHVSTLFRTKFTFSNLTDFNQTLCFRYIFKEKYSNSVSI